MLHRFFSSASRSVGRNGLLNELQLVWNRMRMQRKLLGIVGVFAYRLQLAFTGLYGIFMAEEASHLLCPR